MSTNPPLEYEPIDMLCIAAAREVRNDDAVLVGMGPPLLVCALSKQIHAPGMTYVTESGPIDWVLDPELQAPIQIAEAKLARHQAWGTCRRRRNLRVVWKCPCDNKFRVDLANLLNRPRWVDRLTDNCRPGVA